MDRNESADWRTQGKCYRLSAKQVDGIFFPPVGGKSNRAKRFCSDCPVINTCLQDALINATDGFQAGTTERERQEMRQFLELMPVPVDWFIPREVKNNGRRPKQPRPRVNDLCDPLYGVNGPSPIEEQAMLYNFAGPSDT